MSHEIECPRCDEADERATGWNRCGLCECEFFVAPREDAKPNLITNCYIEPIEENQRSGCEMGTSEDIGEMRYAIMLRRMKQGL